jgi:hypothetical protein
VEGGFSQDDVGVEGGFSQDDVVVEGGFSQDDVGANVCEPETHRLLRRAAR